METTEQMKAVHYHARRRTGSRSDLPGAIREAARFVSASRADFAIRGFVISFLALARVPMAILS
jgi:hypothetical protein